MLCGDRMAEFLAVGDGEEPWEPVFPANEIEPANDIEQVLLPDDSDLVAGIVSEGREETFEDEEFVVPSSTSHGSSAVASPDAEKARRSGPFSV